MKKTTPRAPFGHAANGEALSWPDASLLSIKVPAPLEQHLARYGAIMGVSAEEAGLFLLRNAIIDRHAMIFTDGWKPDRQRYLDDPTETAKRRR